MAARQQLVGASCWGGLLYPAHATAEQALLAGQEVATLPLLPHKRVQSAPRATVVTVSRGAWALTSAVCIAAAQGPSLLLLLLLPQARPDRWHALAPGVRTIRDYHSTLNVHSLAVDDSRSRFTMAPAGGDARWRRVARDCRQNNE